MIRNKFKILIAALSGAFLVTVSSCSKIDEFGSMNTKPNGSLDTVNIGSTHTGVEQLWQQLCMGPRWYFNCFRSLLPVFL